jgi:membrane protein YdbS with pleckstrin-like domain
MNWFIAAVILLIIVITILISIFTYRDWKENFQDEYRDMMLGYERKKKGDGNES